MYELLCMYWNYIVIFKNVINYNLIYNNYSFLNGNFGKLNDFLI